MWAVTCARGTWTMTTRAREETFRAKKRGGDAREESESESESESELTRDAWSFREGSRRRRCVIRTVSSISSCSGRKTDDWRS